VRSRAPRRTARIAARIWLDCARRRDARGEAGEAARGEEQAETGETRAARRGPAENDDDAPARGTVSRSPAYYYKRIVVSEIKAK
jgi:hypothetical protein